MVSSVKYYTNLSAFSSLIACLVATLLAPTVNAEVSDSSEHTKDDIYWADLAQDYPAFVAPQLAARTAARNENITGQWGPVIPWPHIPVSAANLPDGRILTFAASEITGFSGITEYSYSSTWDPASNTFIDTPNDGHDMFCGHLTTLEDGRVFVNGGRNQSNLTSVFDFETNTWSQLDTMNKGRWYPTSVTMPTGSVFTAAGSSGGQYPELWTEGSGWKSLTGASLQGPIIDQSGYENIWFPLLHLDPKGKIFHSGPTPKMHSIDTTGLGKITQVGPDMTEWYPKQGTTIMFDEGKLLVAGGATAGDNQKSTNKAMIIDINGPTPVVTPLEPMANARKFQNAVMLPTGEAMIIGGTSVGAKYNDSGSILEPEIWNPDTKKWRTIAGMTTPRNYHSIALLMTDGRVLAAGGGFCGACAGNHQDGEVLSPPYLFNNDGTLATRPTISNAPDAIKYGQRFTLQSSNDISKFSMIKMSAVTHSINTDVRFINVPFQQAGAGLYELTSHANINVLTPGNWMLFAVNSKGVPSVAKVINVYSSGLPRVTQPRDQVNVIGDSITYSINATDVDSPSLSYQATNLPAGLAINANSGLITGTATQKGIFKPVVTVSDGDSFVSVTFNWNIFPEGSVPGISYEYYEGEWDALPDFSTLTPVSTGVTDTIDTTIRGRTDFYALRFSAVIDLPTAGSYTFYTASDDGSQLFINGEMVVDNDGIHGRVEKSGTIDLAAGLHTLVVTFFEKGGADILEVQYSANGINKQLLPLLHQSPLYNVAPSINNPGDQTTGINQSVTFTINARDLNTTDTLTYSAARLPTGLVINSTTGLITGIPTSSGSYNTLITVDDGKGGSNQIDFKWIVVGNISIQPITASPKASGTLVNYAAVVTGGSNLQYQWNFGDGTATTTASSSPNISHAFTQAGMMVVTLMVSGIGIDPVDYQFTQPIHNPLTANKPNISMSIAYESRSTNDRVWNVNPDNHSVSVFDAVTNKKLAEIKVKQAPHALAIAPDGRIWVSNKESASISVIDPSQMKVVRLITLPNASQPHGIVFSPDGGYAYVALEASNSVVKLHPTSGGQINQVVIGSNPRHLSINAAGTELYASRFITPTIPGEATANVQTTVGGIKYGGKVVKITTAHMSISKRIVLEHSERQDSEHSGRGIPNYLGPMVISPDGLSGWVPSKQDNIKRGMLRDGQPLTHDSTVRSITSRIDLATGLEETGARVDHDNGGIASSAVFGRYGIYLYVALEGSRQVAVLNALDKSEITRILVGFAPQGLTISADGSKLYTHNFIGRSISVHDLSRLNNETRTNFERIAEYDTVAVETLPATVLKGKQLFYDALDGRLAREQYISCAACHNNGADDGRVWDMTSFGEGLRNTISLEGRGGMDHGLLHWTANFDEVQDFEGQIRTLAGGIGLMSDSDFHAGTRDQTLGDKKAGLSADLDALTAYVASLDSFRRSPFQNTNGSLTTQAEAGQAVFVQQQCASCHSGEKFTDSGPNNLHNIGTLKPSSGKRINNNLTGIDTPTLRGVWSTAPYLHDGSAIDLYGAVNAHEGVILTAAEQLQLISYLQQIDGNVDNSNDNNNPVANNQITIDGKLTDWPNSSFSVNDPDDTSGDKNPIDWKVAGFANSDDTLYIAYESYNAINAASNTGTNLTWGWQILIDTDQNAGTGYLQGSIGADYIIEGKHIQRYTGSGNNWSWSSLGNAALAYEGKGVELGINRQLLGDPSTIRLFFRGANQAYGGTTIDLYPNDVSAFLEYQLPGGSDQSNTAPIARNKEVLMSTDSISNITLSASDAEGNDLAYTISVSPQKGTIDGVAPNIIYQPNPGFTGTDRFSFIANDGFNDSNTATVEVTVTNDQSVTVSNELSNTITLDGSSDDWSSVTRFTTDPNDVSGTNETINWRSAAMAHDEEFLHVLYESYNNIDAASVVGNYLPWGWQVYLDTDKSSSTGFKVGNIGADFIIEGQSIHRYVGLGTNWNWENIGVADWQYAGNFAELRFPRSLIGNPDSVRLLFRGFNSAIGGTLIDDYPDGQNNRDSSEQFFKYEFTAGAYANGKPLARSQSLSTNTNSSLSLILGGQDPLGGELSYTVTKNPQHGTLSGDAPNMVYTPDSGYKGNDSIKYLVNNGTQNSLPATISIKVSTATTNNMTVVNNVPNLTIDGSIDDWNNLTAFADDPDDMALNADTINWQSATMAHSLDSLYLQYRNRGMINANTPTGSYIPWGWQTYLDTDDDPTTGYRVGDIGADYIIEATSVNEYTGTNNSWDWKTVAVAEVAYNNDVAELSLPLVKIGNPSQIKIVFSGNNISVGGSNTDLYPDNADTQGAANNYFAYTLANALARVSLRPSANNQTVSLTENMTSSIRLNAIDPDGENLSYKVVKEPANGTLTIINGVGTYQPNIDYIGNDSFEYFVNDGTFDSSMATVSLLIKSDDSTAVDNGELSNNEESGGGSVDWHLGTALLFLVIVAYRRRLTVTLR